MIHYNLTIVGNLMILLTLVIRFTLMSFANVGHNSCQLVVPDDLVTVDNFRNVWIKMFIFLTF